MGLKPCRVMDQCRTPDSSHLRMGPAEQVAHSAHAEWRVAAICPRPPERSFTWRQPCAGSNGCARGAPTASRKTSIQWPLAAGHRCGWTWPGGYPLRSVRSRSTPAGVLTVSAIKPTVSTAAIAAMRVSSVGNSRRWHHYYSAPRLERPLSRSMAGSSRPKGVGGNFSVERPVHSGSDRSPVMSRKSELGDSSHSRQASPGQHKAAAERLQANGSNWNCRPTAVRPLSLLRDRSTQQSDVRLDRPPGHRVSV